MGKIGKIAFVGGGAMGEAILKGILNAKLADGSDITVSDPSEQRREYLQNQYGINTTAENTLAVKKADAVILAVKPQMADAAITREVAQVIPEAAVVISIMGSVDLKKLHELIPGRAIIVSALDNLTKGASGQAIQNANLLLGFAEGTGIDQPAVFP